jgi:hypothetical protein
MNEPEHPHFVLSDASYVHMMEEGWIVGKKDLPKETPTQKDGPDRMSVILLGAATGITLFFAVMTAITGMYLITFLMGGMMLLSVQNLLRSFRYSQTMFIPRNAISGVTYSRKSFGFDSFVVTYKGKNGQDYKRRFSIYDSKDCLLQALEAVHNEGWM